MYDICESVYDIAVTYDICQSDMIWSVNMIVVESFAVTILKV